MGYETDPAGAYAYPDGQTLYANMADPNEVNDLANVDLSRYFENNWKTTKVTFFRLCFFLLCGILILHTLMYYIRNKKKTTK